MKASKVLILSGVVFCSLLTCQNTFAVDTYPDNSVNYVNEGIENGFQRKATALGYARINYSCKFQRIGEMNFFPLKQYNNGVDYVYTDTPCGYYYDSSSSSVAGPFSNINNFYTQSAFSLNSHSHTNGSGYNNVVDSLYNPSAFAGASYVSAFNRASLGYNFGNPLQGDGLTIPIDVDNGYAFLVMTITNSYGDAWGYNTTAVAPLLSQRSKDMLTIDSGNITANDIIDTINGSATAGWVWEDSSGNKQNTFKSCQDSMDSGCTRIIPESDSFAAIENYLDTLDVGSFFAIYAFPVYSDAGYHFSELHFDTPKNLSEYGLDFAEIENENAYWGLPFIYSSGYPNLVENSNYTDPLHVEYFGAGLSFLYINPITAEGFSYSRTLASNLANAHNNSLRYQNGLSQLEPVATNGFWGGIFNLGNIIFPFQSFLSGFTNQQCVNIPILGAWLSIGANTQYCSWWSSDIRDVLTPVFAASSMMLLFGFIVHWLRKSDSDKLSYKETS